MNINDFPLSWRWTESSHAKLPQEILDGLQPLNEELAQKLSSQIPVNFPVGATRLDASADNQATTEWLSKLDVKSKLVTISWKCDTALALPWTTFCKYWDDFCYPSSDDADLFLENGQHFLRWNHYEVFELDLSAI
ncbi:hypothetical protein [Shewanella kaireitica]|uniref:hypothetical protein n=1 Tax=Shewanella kaireitica TaxID=212021 RepID=UPI0020102995|nr:hypothetical protein [Shewanella kaireitica]MCL1092937.1 hypothetical protein [Shewanella kaireitica]